MTQHKETPPTIITLTLPTPEGGGIAPERATATLLIQRGELAHLRQFHYNGQMADLIVAIREAHDALGSGRRPSTRHPRSAGGQAEIRAEGQSESRSETFRG